MKSSGIGGQAVLEGVMMKYKSDYSVAVRKPDGEINVIHGKCKSISEKSVFFRLPIIRGVVNFVESMVLGMRTLTYSADYYEEEEVDENKSQTEKFETVLTVIFAILLAFGVFMVLPLFLSQLLHNVAASSSVSLAVIKFNFIGEHFNIKISESPVSLAIIEGIIRIILFIGYVLAISLMKDIKRVFMYHGAEHKSINCVENGLELTVENVRLQSKHHRRCGTSFLFIVMFISIVCFMFISFENVMLRIVSRILLVPVIAGISYEFIRFAGNTDNKFVAFLSKPGMLMQRLTTREPDDEMIEVAIASINEIFDWRGYQRRLMLMKNMQEEQARKAKNAAHKSRSQVKEELLERERENKQRAKEQARIFKEMAEKETELERIADEASKREKEEDAKVDEVMDNKDTPKSKTKAKILNFSDYKEL